MLAVPVPAQHGPRRHVDERQPHRGRAHDERGRRLVAAAHQHGAVDRVRAQHFLGLHREEIAIEHAARLLEGLGHRHHRQLDRETARLPHAALHFLGARAEMGVAGQEIAPGVDDPDHRLAAEIRARVSHLQRARAMPLRAQTLAAEPFVAAQVFRFQSRAFHKRSLIKGRKDSMAESTGSAGKVDRRILTRRLPPPCSSRSRTSRGAPSISSGRN